MGKTPVFTRPPSPVAETLEELVHAPTGLGPWKIYVFQRDGYHRGGIWFRRGKAKYPDEEISFVAAKVKCANAGRNGLEVRICDGGDNLVFHAKGETILHGADFWKEAEGASK